VGTQVFQSFSQNCSLHSKIEFAYSIILQLCRSVVYALKWDIEAEILAAWPNFSSPQSIAVELKLAGIAVFEWVLQLDLQEFNCSVWGSTATLFWICRDFLKNPRSDTAIQPSLKTIYHQKKCIFYLANLWSCSLKCLCWPVPISAWTVSWCPCDNSRSACMNWIHFFVVTKSTKTPWLHTAWHESLTSSLAMERYSVKLQTNYRPNQLWTNDHLRAKKLVKELQQRCTSRDRMTSGAR
jgi:hypothetical protein